MVLVGVLPGMSAGRRADGPFKTEAEARTDALDAF